MIRRDKFGYIVDVNLDGGDSANRAGLSALFGNREPLEKYEIRPGVLVRHPVDEPWNNPRNFTRDQLLPFVAGAWRLGLYDLNRRVFWAHARRFFFAQNFERDVAGSKKRPWPQKFVNDRGDSELRLFDFADPLGPSDIWHLILCAKIRWLYGMGLIGYPSLFLAVIFHGLFDRSDDEGQIIAKAVVGGQLFRWLYKRTNPNWRQALKRYWVDRRQMREMYNLLQS